MIWRRSLIAIRSSNSPSVTQREGRQVRETTIKPPAYSSSPPVVAIGVASLSASGQQLGEGMIAGLLLARVKRRTPDAVGFGSDGVRGWELGWRLGAQLCSAS